MGRKKSASNEKKHGISFEEAKSAFTDQFARLIPILIILNKKTDLFFLVPASTLAYWLYVIA
jgi:hypothetical protein